MKKSKGSAASMAGVVVISVVLSAVLFIGADYLVLPSIYPSLKTQKINQTFYTQWANYAILDDSQLSYVQINQTSTLFTVKNANSHIYALFTIPILLTLDTTFTGYVYFNISLVIKGIGNMTTPIVYTDQSAATGNYRQAFYPITLQFMTGSIAAGTYNISIQWKSVHNEIGFNYLDAGDRSSIPYQYARTLFVEEITQ